MRFLLRWPIRTQLLFLVTISILPALGIIIYSGVEQRRDKIEDVQNLCVGLMQTIANRQQVVMESTRQFLITLARMPEVQDLNRQACNTLFKDLLSENPIYANIFMLSKDGIVLESAVPSKPWDFRERKYFKDALSTHRFSAGEYIVAVIAKKPVLTLSYPIFDKRGDIKGVLAASLDLTRYDFIISEAKLPAKSVIVLSDHKGTRIYRYPEGEKYLGLQIPPEIMRHMQGDSDEGTFLEKGVDGVKRFYAYKGFRLSKDSPPYLHVRVGIPEQAALSEAWSVTMRNLVILGIVYVLALALAWFFGSYLISKPVRSLVAVTDRFRRGERDVTTGLPHADNELGQLAQAFDKMSADLKQREDEQKQAEDALRKSEERYRILADNASDIIWSVNMDLKFTYASPAIERLLGWTVNEWKSLQLRDMMPPASLETVMEILAGELAAEQNPDADPRRTRTVELEMYRKDGATISAELKAGFLRDEESRPAGIMGITRDITARKQAEEALKNSEAKFRAIVENTHDGILFADAQGGILYRSPSYQAITGYADKERLGHSSLEMLHPDDQEEAARIWQEMLHHPETLLEVQYRTRHKDGTWRWVETYVKNLLDNPDVRAVFVTTRDVTERKRLEEERRRLEERLQRAEKMEALGTLAGGVAHDLNNVMGIVVGYAELLLHTIEETHPLRPSLVNIMDAGQRAAAIVQDLLTLTRRGVPNRQVINLNRVVSDCLKSPEFEKLSAYHPSVKTEMYLEPDLLNISGSAVHLSKSLFNLISNASEAMPKGGTVTIRTANQYLDKPVQGYDQIQEGDYVILTVSDTGEGISQADLQRIFEPFYTKKIMGRSGTGLGLSVVWGTVKDHNGYINVQSEIGKESIFTLYFPVTREEITPEVAALSRSAYMGRGESILVVDDVKGQRDLAASILQTLNYRVKCVSSGEEALAYLKEHSADLIILDMIMDPGMDGLDTYTKVREIKPQQKAIIVSGFSESDRVRAAQALGVGAYVRKPYVIEKLGLAVREELDRK